jgi:hypothetical protein
MRCRVRRVPASRGAASVIERRLERSFGGGLITAEIADLYQARMR